MWPITLFDKSFIEMLNVDEAAIFDVLYSSVICPIFYTEVLADLSKQPPGERTVERIIADVARKTPVLRASPNMGHTSICAGELAGFPVEIRGVPVLAGGRPVRGPDGKAGVVFDEAPESKAFNRWQRGRFHEVERDFAADWRRLLSSVDHAAAAKLVKSFLNISTQPRDLAETMGIARQAVHGDGQRFLTLKTAYSLLGLPRGAFPKVQARWVRLGRPSLSDFAPYTAHCLLVDVFFHVAIDKKLISPERPSNRIDMAYLYYLPFSMLFVSNDKLHRRAAPFFLRDDQMFVFGDDLKKDLARLDTYFMSRPEEERRQGLMNLAKYPPKDDTFLTTQIWKKFGFDFESRVGTATPRSKDRDDELLKMVRKLQSAANAPAGSFSNSELANPNHVSIERLVPLQRGKWRIMPPGVEAHASSSELDAPGS